jgi:hypothetical protein
MTFVCKDNTFFLILSKSTTFSLWQVLSLAGQRVAAGTKGLLFVNGKKKNTK